MSATCCGDNAHDSARCHLDRPRSQYRPVADTMSGPGVRVFPRSVKILLVEDDAMIGAAVQEGLRRAGYAVDWARDGRAAELALAAEHYGLMLLDLGLPKKSGLDLLAEIRRKGNSTPVLILTARDAV